MEYLLLIIMHFSIGYTEPLYIEGSRYTSRAECAQHGERTADWLTQDFVDVEFRCLEVTIASNGTEGRSVHYE